MGPRKFSFFISHASEHKELARYIYYNSIANGLYPWYDEALLALSDVLKEEIENGINSSQAFLLLHSKVATSKEWVKKEMEIARARYESDKSFKLFVVKIDNEPLEEFWKQFLYKDWNQSGEVGSIIGLIESLTGKKGLIKLTTAALLSENLSDLSLNKTSTIAEQTRNFIVYNLAHIKTLLSAIAHHGYESEMKDSIQKLLNAFVFSSTPSLHGGFIHIGNGELEFIHGNRMRIPPKVVISGIPEDRYKVSLSINDEVITRIKIIDINTGTPVDNPVPFFVSMSLEADM